MTMNTDTMTGTKTACTDAESSVGTHFVGECSSWLTTELSGSVRSERFAGAMNGMEIIAHTDIPWHGLVGAYTGLQPEISMGYTGVLQNVYIHVQMGEV